VAPAASDGLATVSMALGQPEEALARVEEILRYLDEKSLDGTDEPFRVYLTCYDGLRAAADDRAYGLLHEAQEMLLDRARKIDEPELRRSFLQRVPAHRELAQRWQNRDSGP
jgi:hypothetical protein